MTNSSTSDSFLFIFSWCEALREYEKLFISSNVWSPEEILLVWRHVCWWFSRGIQSRELFSHHRHPSIDFTTRIKTKSFTRPWPTFSFSPSNHAADVAYVAAVLASDFDPQLWSLANRSDSNSVICSFLGHRSPKKIWFSFLAPLVRSYRLIIFVISFFAFFLCVALEEIDTKKGSNFHWYLSALSFRTLRKQWP